MFFFVGIFLVVTSNFTGRYAGVFGVLLTLFAFVMLIGINQTSLGYLKEVIPTFNFRNKIILRTIYWFTKSLPLLLGLFFLTIFLLDDRVKIDSLIEINGKVEKIWQDHSTQNPYFNIKLQQDPRKYSIPVFFIPKGKKKQIVRELKYGDEVFLLINPNDRVIEIYGIRTNDDIYFSYEDYLKTVSENKLLGKLLGIIISIIGLGILIRPINK